VPSVQLRFTPLPEHVRTARLVATSVARRLGFQDDELEAVRLAVGEACSRAVRRSEAQPHPAPVEVDLQDDDRRLVIEVRDHAAAEHEPAGDLSLTLVDGLADTVTLGAGPGGDGGYLRLEWRARG
jgi:anti-sigma regulatory factor (Ser/Thr protein kinase)